MKKVTIAFGIGFLSIFLILAGLIIIPNVQAQVMDDMALRKYRTNILEELKLPANTAVAETIEGCGNTSGTGNHTELYVAVLLKTDLSEDAMREYYPSALSAEECKWKTLTMVCVGVSFTEQTDGGNYYILEFIESAPYSAIDLRGY